MKKLVHDDLRNYVTSRLFYSLGVQLIAVFVPLLLMRHGLVLWQVWAFYGGMGLSGLLLIYPCVQVINRMGVKAGYTIGYLALAAYFVLLTVFVARGYTWVLIMLPFTWALSCVFTMCCVTLYVGKAMDVSRKGQDSAIIEFVIRVAAALGPAAGAFIATTAGPLWLNISAVLLLMASLAILLETRNMEPPQRGAPAVRYVTRPPLRDLVAVVSYDITTDIAGIVWPAYLAVVTPGFQAVGFVMTGAGLLVLPLIARVGWLIDNGRYKRAIIGAITSVTIINALRFMSVDSIWLTLLTASFSMALAVLTVAWNSSYRHSVREYGLTYLLWTQTTIWVSCTVLFTVLAVLARFDPDPRITFVIAFLLNGGMVWGCLLMRRVK